MIRAAAAALVGVAGLGCGGGRAAATQLVAAAQPGHLPLVVACWEKEVEGAGFQGEYTATVDFVVEGETSRLREAKVRSVEPASGGAPAGGEGNGGSLAACVEAALNRSALPVAADRDGPGFKTPGDLAVRGYRIAFVAAPEGRERASARQAHVLIGPRADRCQGLYTHDPPRDASALFAEVAEREARAQGLASESPDQYARARQRVYDLQLELRGRLRLDALDPALPAANRRRVLEALDGADRAAREAGALIGCEPPPLP